jgi:diacylglycerol kinase (ATP)
MEPTVGPQTAGDLARRAIDDGADLILAAGGDGTINEVANGMVHTHVPLGIIPGGTANVLATELGIRPHADRAVRMLTQSLPERVAVGRLKNAMGERYFLLMAGVGLDAHIVYHMDTRLKDALGKISYWAGALSHLKQRVAEFTTTINGEPRRCGFALASRVKNYGGDLEIATGASLLGDDFEAVLFKGRNPWRYLLYFFGVVTRTLPQFKGISLTRTRKLEFSSPADHRIYVQVDGEYAGQLPATVEIVEDALTLLLPADFRERLTVRVTEALLPA